MPGGNGTGPLGLGPKTGRGAGFCAGHPNPGHINPQPGRGSIRGFGFGRGFGLESAPECRDSVRGLVHRLRSGVGWRQSKNEPCGKIS